MRVSLNCILLDCIGNFMLSISIILEGIQEKQLEFIEQKRNSIRYNIHLWVASLDLHFIFWSCTPGIPVMRYSLWMSLDNFMLWYKGFFLFSKIHRHVSRLIIHCGYHWQYLVEERSAGAENWAFNISSKVIGYLSRHSREASWIQWTKEQFYQRYNIHFWTIIPFLHINIFFQSPDPLVCRK